MNQSTHKRVFADIPIFSYETVVSTQEIARESLESAQNGVTLDTDKCNQSQILAVFSANHQIAGMGRRGRSWESKTGSSLLCTYVIRKDDSNPWLNIARLIVANVRVLNELNIPVYIKWPNDIVDGYGKKLGGCLTEIVGDFLCVGVGINLNAGAYGEDLQDLACSSETFGIEINRDSYIDSVLENYLESFNILGEYKSLSHTLGKNIDIEQISKSISGKAVDINADGSLLLETSTGEVHCVIEGDVVHARIKS